MDHLEKIEKRKWIFPDSDSGTKTCRPEPLTGNRVKRTDIVLFTCFQEKITTGQSPLNVSLWTEGRTHTGPSPLDNMTA
jgi:hypothetical protein